jgi:hypothetical protein
MLACQKTKRSIMPSNVLGPALLGPFSPDPGAAETWYKYSLILGERGRDTESTRRTAVSEAAEASSGSSSRRQKMRTRRRTRKTN